MSGELISMLENTVRKILQKHPEIEDLLTKLYYQPWENVAGKWRKRSADKTMLLTIDTERVTAQIDFLNADCVD